MKMCRVCNKKKTDKEFYNIQTKCKVCYRKHYNEKRERRMQEAYENVGGECQHCGVKDDRRAFFDWHHIDPLTKTENSLSGNIGDEAFWMEIDKCVMLCPSCHREEHLSGETYNEIKKRRALIRKIEEEL